MIKKCTKCGVEKPFSEFYKEKTVKSGLRSSCKDCERLRNKIYREKNKEKVKKHAKEYCKKNKEKLKDTLYKWREENPEKFKTINKRYYEKNKENLNEKTRNYYNKNREACLQQKSEYFQKNKDKIREYNRRYHQNMTAGIYQITNTKTGVVYIGCSTQIPRRWRDHKGHLKKNKHINKSLQKDYNKYGLEELEFEVIKEYPPDTPFEVLEREETKLILEHKTKGTPMYNLSIKISSIDESHLTL